MALADVVIHAGDAALEDAEEAFGAVRVHVPRAYSPSECFTDSCEWNAVGPCARSRGDSSV